MALTTTGAPHRYFGPILCVLVLRAALLSAQGTPANFDELAANASAARESGASQDAIRYYGEALRLRPHWEEGWWYLGSLLYDADRFADAVAPFRQVTQLDPNLGAAWAFLGLCEFELGRNPSSLEHLQRAQKLGFEEYPQLRNVALYHLALLLNSTGEFEKSNQLLVSEFATGRIPDQIQLAMGMALLRIPLLPSRLDPSKDALVHAAGEAAALLAEKNFDTAFQNFPNMVQNYPDTPYLHYAFGNAFVAAGRTDQAESEFREEIRTHPNSPLAWIALSSLALQLRRPSDALVAAKHGEEVAPDNVTVLSALADAYQALGQGDLARTARARQAKLSGQPLGVEAAQVTRYSMQVEHADSTPVSGSAGTSASGITFEAAVHEGEVAQQAGRLDEASKFYHEALQLRPGWTDAWRRLGTIAYMQERYPEAIAALQKTVKTDPKQADAWTLLGLSEFQTKDYKNARLHLERANDLGFGGNAAAVKVAAYHLAILLTLEGKFDRATDVLIPYVGSGPLELQIQNAMGLAILRIPSLPEQVDADRRALISKAGAIASQLAQRHYDQAFPMFDALLVEYPKTPFLHYAYGASLANISEFDRAQVQLREEIGINPDSPLPYIRLASVLLMVDQSESALQVAKMAVQLGPKSPDSHYVLGRAMLEQGDSENAVKELELARQLAPGSPAVHFNLARAYTKAHRVAEADRERAEFERLNRIMTGQSPSQRAESGLSQASEGKPDSNPAR